MSLKLTVEYLHRRRLIYQMANIEFFLDKDVSQLSFYVGFDCTAPSLHLGNAVQLRALKSIAKISKAKPIVLLGGATTLIGDPSGKSSARPSMQNDKVEQNVFKIRNQIARYLGSKHELVVVNNIDWLSQMTLFDFLSTVGISLGVNRMVHFENVSNRINSGAGISLSEFCYMGLQAYDFYHLHKNYQCFLQIGGSDQWANIICGVDTIRKCADGAACAITLPLLTKSDGEKWAKQSPERYGLMKKCTILLGFGTTYAILRISS